MSEANKRARIEYLQNLARESRERAEKAEALFLASPPPEIRQLLADLDLTANNFPGGVADRAAKALRWALQFADYAVSLSSHDRAPQGE